MALVLKDRVRETSTTTGTGSFTLGGTSTGFQSFSVIGDGNTTYYGIVNSAAGEWEVGVGTYTASGAVLSRDTILESSNGGSAVNFSAGTKDVFVTYPAERSASTDTFASPPAIGSTTPAAGTFTTLTATGQTSLGGAAGSESLRVNSVASAVNWVEVSGDSSVYPSVKVAGTGSALELRLSSKGGGSVGFFTNNIAQRQFNISHTASAVNYVQATGSATGSGATISAQGSDTNVGLAIRGKGSGFVSFGQDTTTQFAVSRTSSAVNYLLASGGIAGNAPTMSAFGSDTNISQVFQSKGTGAIDLAAGSRGVNISNGGTVTAITGTNIGSSYTSFPSVVISAPTTAGGVQATATVAGMISNNPVTIVSGGTGYTVGDTLTVVGGTSISGAATLTVNSVSGGVITAVFNLNFAGYTVLPTNPVSVTGGTGSGATFNLTYSLRSASGFTITNAGSGYVEQPTVTFSGGGGSGAAAYATVGKGAIIRSIGTTGTSAIDFQGSASASNNAPILRLRDSNTGTSSNTGYIQIQNASSYTQIVAQGPATTHLNIASNGDGRINFNTRSTSEVTQMRVSDTASAVNYVQVTGAATGGHPKISTQGSDANSRLILDSKGSSSGIDLLMNGSRQVFIGTNGSAVNYFLIGGSAAGSSPAFSVNGSDTNIDLTLTPKGTGQVKIGTNSVAINGPAFSAYPSSNQAAPSIGTWTKVTFDTELYDTNSNFASSRFTPTVAGYYQLTYSIYMNTSSTALMTSAIYRNGAIWSVGFITTAVNPVYSTGGSSLVYFNGSTDYAEIYIYLSNSTALYGSQAYTYFQGFLARAA